MRRRYYRRKKGNAKKEQPFFKEGNVKVQTKEEKQPFFQTKEEGLKVGRPGDKYEVEADAMADAVMSNSQQAKAIQRKEITSIQRAAEEELQAKIQRQEIEEEPEVQQQAEEDEVQMQEEEELQQKSEEDEVQMQEEEELQQKSEEEEVQNKEEEELRTKSSGNPGSTNRTGRALTNKIKNSKSGGRPLSPTVKRKMEGAFGADFNKVAIHTDAKAVQLNNELRAQAFTHGNNIYFNQGKYDPDSSKGQHLLAHELTHVLQQKGKEDCQKVSRSHFSSGYTSWAATPHQIPAGEPQTYSIDFYIRAALEVNLVQGLDSSAVKTLIESSLTRHGGGWKEIRNNQGEVTRAYVRFNLHWVSFNTISTEVLEGSALGVSVLPDDNFAEIGADGMFVHDGNTNRILLKGGPANAALLQGRRNRAQRQRGENRFGNEVSHEMGHALGLEHRARTVMNRSNTESAARQFDGQQIRQMMLNTTTDSASLPAWITGQVTPTESP